MCPAISHSQVTGYCVTVSQKFPKTPNNSKKQRILLSNFCSDSIWSPGIANTEQATRRCARSEPVSTRQALHQRYKMRFQSIRSVLLGDLPQRLHSLVSNHSLFHSCQTFQRRLNRPKRKIRKENLLNQGRYKLSPFTGTEGRWHM